MSEPLVVMACDGLFEFEPSEIAAVAYEDRGIRVLLKTGFGFLLIGHEAAQLLEAFAGKIRKAIS
jgi:hypothetical protein